MQKIVIYNKYLGIGMGNKIHKFHYYNHIFLCYSLNKNI